MTLGDQRAVAQAESRDQYGKYEMMKEQYQGLNVAYDRWEQGWRLEEHEFGYHSAQSAVSFDDRDLEA